MREIKKGDLVFGLRPWNDFTRVGVVISEPVTEPLAKCRVFWYAPEPSEKLETKRVFVLEELTDSIEAVRSCDA